MSQKQKSSLNKWNRLRSVSRSELARFARAPLQNDLTMWGFTLHQLQSFLPFSRDHDCTGPSSAPFLHEALRNGVEDVNILNAAIWVLEWRWKVKQPDARDFDRQLLEDAESKFHKLSLVNDRLLTLYLEFPFKTSYQETIGHIPQVVYKKDSWGNRRKRKPFSFDYTNEFGQISHVHGIVSSGTDIRFIPYLDRSWNLIVYNWSTNLWDNTRVSFAPDAWDLNPDGTFVHISPALSRTSSRGNVPPASYQPCCMNPEQHSLIRTLGQHKYFEVLGHERPR